MSVQSKLSRGTSGVPGYNLPSRGRLSAGYYTIGTVIFKGAAWESKSLRLVFILLWFCCCCCNSGYQTQGHALPWLCASLHIFFLKEGEEEGGEGGRKGGKEDEEEEQQQLARREACLTARLSWCHYFACRVKHLSH